MTLSVYDDNILQTFCLSLTGFDHKHLDSPSIYNKFNFLYCPGPQQRTSKSLSAVFYIVTTQDWKENLFSSLVILNILEQEIPDFTQFLTSNYLG